MQEIIQEIIKRLDLLKDTYPEINNIIIDLANNNLTSLEIFIKTHYSDLPYSNYLKLFVEKLVEHNMINSDYLDYFTSNNSYELLNSKEVENTNEENDEILSLEPSDIEILRKTYFEAQLNYLNHPVEFIQSLENMNELDIYNSLLNLGNISYIQHSLANLSIDTLKRFLIFIEEKEKEEHNMINSFIEESVKRNIHLNSKKK